MNLTELKDRAWIIKESIKSKVLDAPIFNKLEKKSLNINFSMLIKTLGLKKIEKVVNGKPNSIIIIADGMVVRVPLDKLTATRCRLNAKILRKLQTTSIAAFVPRILKSGKFQNYTYYCEEKLPGVTIDIPISKMDELVEKATDFITKFHQETAQPITIDEAHFKRLFAREISRLSPYLSSDYQAKLNQIERSLKQSLLGKPFKTVWFHGDYNVENVLFDTKTWQITGIIDWDLSRDEGLPLLDILYLLTYKESLITKQNVVDIFKNKLLTFGFNGQQQEIIDKYLQSLGISDELIKPLLIMFCINNISQRYRKELCDIDLPDRKNWKNENVYSVIDAILRLIVEKQ